MTEEEIVRELQSNKDLANRNEARIKKLEDGQRDIRDLTKSVSEMVSEQKYMNIELTEVKTDVKQIKEKPAKRWDAMVEKVLMLVIAAVVAWMLGKIGL